MRWRIIAWKCIWKGLFKTHSADQSCHFDAIPQMAQWLRKWDAERRISWRGSGGRCYLTTSSKKQLTVASLNLSAVVRAAALQPLQDEQPQVHLEVPCQLELHFRGRLPEMALLIQPDWKQALPVIISQPAVAVWRCAWNTIHLFIHSVIQKCWLDAMHCFRLRRSFSKS